MPHFDIIRTANPEKTFRVSSVMGTYDLADNKVTEHFVGDIQLPEKWNIGVIVGRSGTGKTTIARELFGKYMKQYTYTHECFLDDFPKDVSMREIEKTLVSVGLSSVTSWLKSYHVLSNGEKMRCDIARAILEHDDMTVFDEFTSVVDRNIAKVSSLAIQKAIRRGGGRFIAVSCHEDIIEYLMPDWIFDTNTMTFSALDVEEQKKNRRKFTMRIYEITRDKQQLWRTFARYHYLSEHFNSAARVFVATIDEQIAAFCAALPFPHPHVKNTWREHRTVVLPDYQGIGIGTAISNFVGEYFQQRGKRYISTTSNPAMIVSRQRSPLWRCTRLSRVSTSSLSGFQNIKDKSSTSARRITAAFEYIGEKCKYLAPVASK